MTDVAGNAAMRTGRNERDEVRPPQPYTIPDSTGLSSIRVTRPHGLHSKKCTSPPDPEADQMRNRAAEATPDGCQRDGEARECSDR